MATKTRTSRRRRRAPPRPSARGKTKTPTARDTRPQRTIPTHINPSGSDALTIELPRLLTVDEVAGLLRTTRKAIYCQVQRGALPGVIRLSRRILFDGGALLEWLDQQRAVSLTIQGEKR